MRSERPDLRIDERQLPDVDEVVLARIDDLDGQDLWRPATAVNDERQSSGRGNRR